MALLLITGSTLVYGCELQLFAFFIENGYQSLLSICNVIIQIHGGGGKPHLGLQHIQPSTWIFAGGILWGSSETRPSRAWLQVAPPQFSFAREERNLLSEASHLVNKCPLEIFDAPTLENFKWLLGLAWSFLFPSMSWLPCSFNFHFTWFE